MKLCIIITLLLGWATFTFGQDKDLDSLGFPLNHTNVISRSTDEVDSIQSSFYNKSDSLKQKYKNRFTKLDSTQSVLQSKLDKLRSIQLPSKNMGSSGKMDSVSMGFITKLDSASARIHANKITDKIDSINELRQKALSNLDEDLQSLKSKTTEKLNNLEFPPQLKDKVSNVQESISDFKIPISDVTIPSLKTGQNSLSKLNNLSLETPALNLQSPVVDIGKVGSLPNVQGDIGGISDLTTEVSGYGKDIQQVTKGGLSELKDMPQTAEEQAAELSGLEGIKEQTKVLDEYKDAAGQMQNPDSLKEVAVLEIRQYAVNHFAGKEEQLKEAMETMSKYKMKYASLNSISEATKRPPNEMRGKPLLERIVPGIAFQLQKRGEDLLVDFNVSAGYRFTGRLMAGAGWNQRVAYNTKKNYSNPNARIFGPRAFGEFKLWKGFSPRAELEVMNTMVPTLARTPSLDPGTRQWVWGAFVGMKKEYTFIKSIKGTALVMVRLYNPEHKSPYADVLNVRFGFEFPMKKKIKDKKS